jgi:hypothetical protein
MAIGQQPVSARVGALLADAPRSQPVLSLVTIALLVLALAATLMVEKHVEDLFELAGQVYQASRS